MITWSPKPPTLNYFCLLMCNLVKYYLCSKQTFILSSVRFKLGICSDNSFIILSNDEFDSATLFTRCCIIRLDGFIDFMYCVCFALQGCVSPFRYLSLVLSKLVYKLSCFVEKWSSSFSFLSIEACPQILSRATAHPVKIKKNICSDSLHGFL